MVISWTDKGQTLLSCKQFIRQVDTVVNDKMFWQKYGPRKMTLEKPVVGRFRLPRVRPWGKAPNRELPPKSGDITCMPIRHNAQFCLVTNWCWTISTGIKEEIRIYCSKRHMKICYIVKKNIKTFQTPTILHSFVIVCCLYLSQKYMYD